MTSLASRACSFLFVPATRPERLPKALASGADMVIVDWEDAVAPADKPAARTALHGAVAALDRETRRRVLVRVNAQGTPWFEGDVAAATQLVAAGCAGAMLPKAERAVDLQALAQALGSHAALVALIESVAGLDVADALASAPQVARLAFGNLDFQVDAGMHCGADEVELLPVRARVVLAARRAGLSGPLDGVTTDARNTERTRADAERAWRQGFGGKLCIHPAQVVAVHAAFAPDPDSVAWARRVQQADQTAGGSVCVLDGRMVDAPVVRQAEEVLRRFAWAQQRLA